MASVNAQVRTFLAEAFSGRGQLEQLTGDYFTEVRTEVNWGGTLETQARGLLEALQRHGMVDRLWPALREERSRLIRDIDHLEAAYQNQSRLRTAISDRPWPSWVSASGAIGAATAVIVGILFLIGVLPPGSDTTTSTAEDSPATTEPPPATGTSTVTPVIPDLAGLSFLDATAALELTGIRVSGVEYLATDVDDAGLVVGLDPPPGEKAASVTVILSEPASLVTNSLATVERKVDSYLFGPSVSFDFDEAHGLPDGEEDLQIQLDFESHRVQLSPWSGSGASLVGEERELDCSARVRINQDGGNSLGTTDPLDLPTDYLCFGTTTMGHYVEVRVIALDQDRQSLVVEYFAR